MAMESRYDVLVVGGGHAGVEAAAAAARLGSRTLLLTPDLSRVGQMSCNPAVGGVAKGIVAREVDALGGIMGRATDKARIHFRMLNSSKGPAVWGPRAQCDRGLYPRAVRESLDELEWLDLFQGMAIGLEWEGEGGFRVLTRGGVSFRGSAVVVTAGTFLRGKIHVGTEGGLSGGRAGEPPSVELAENLEDWGLEVARFKTGTPPRVDGRTVDFSSAFALAIRYSRNFKGDRIAQRSAVEIERLSIADAGQIADWEARMARIFPDVRAGETLTGLYYPGRGAEFYHQDRPVGRIADPAFARAFFSIWLDPRTREPELRQRLIGQR